MPGDDDRNDRNAPRTKTGRRTPPGGERAVPLFVEPDEDKTPVTSDPFVRIEYHQKKAENRADLALSEIKALHQKLDDTTKRHDQLQARDDEEHRRLSDSINRVAKESVATRAKVDTLGDKLNDTALAMREQAKEQAFITGSLTKEQATVTAQLGLALEDLRAIKRLEEHEKKVTIETEAMIQRTETETNAMVRRTETQELAATEETKRKEMLAEGEAKRKQNAKILQIVGAALGSTGIVTAIVLAILQAKC